MKKFLFFISLLLVISTSLEANIFNKREINIYFNSLKSDNVSIIEDLNFYDNVSFIEKEKYLNKSFLKNNFPFFTKEAYNIDSSLLNQDNTLEIKYTSSLFDLFDKKGRFIKKIIYCYAFRNCIDNILYLDNNTTLNIYISSKYLDNFEFSKSFEEQSNKKVTSDGIYTVFSFTGPTKIINFYIIKRYMEDIIPFDFFKNLDYIYILTFIIIFILFLLYRKEIIFFIKWLIKNEHSKSGKS